MIKHLYIQNFLSHKDTEIEFSPGVNIIVGESDSGKSAIIRALRWLILNRPVGDSYRSNWGGETSAEIVTEDYVIGRIRDDKINSYVLGEIKGSNLQTFKAIRSEVPEEISKVLNLNESNVQSQFESHFLLSRSPGEVAQYFNGIAHLDKIDTGLKNINKWVKEIQATVNADRDELQRLEGSLGEYSNISTIEEKVGHLEALLASEEEMEDAHKRIIEVIDEIIYIDKELYKFSIFLEAGSVVDRLLEVRQERTQIKKDKFVLEKTIADVERVDVLSNEAMAVLPALDLVDSLIVIENKEQKISQSVKELAWDIEVIESVLFDQDKVKKELVELEKEFHKYMGEVCPLCGNKITG